MFQFSCASSFLDDKSGESVHHHAPRFEVSRRDGEITTMTGTRGMTTIVMMMMMMMIVPMIRTLSITVAVVTLGGHRGNRPWGIP